MSNGWYFSQYESPNIVIVPTMSLSKPPSPKRRKIGNNIIVPMVDNTSFETEKLKYNQENNKQKDSNAVEKVDKNENSSKSSTTNDSWASKYLQSIGLDKKSSIWTHKIPRKSASQNVFAEEPSKAFVSDVGPTSTSRPKLDTKKSKLLKIPSKVVTSTNMFKDKSNMKTKRHMERKKHVTKVNSKESKQSKCEPINSSLENNIGDRQNNKILDILTFKNKNTINDPNKIKTDSIKKRDLYKQPIQSTKIATYTNNPSISGNSFSPNKSKNEINKTSQKDIYPKVSTQHSLIGPRKNSPKKVKNSIIKSVVIKNKHKQENAKCIVKNNTRQKYLTNKSSSYVTGQYKDKYKNQEHPIADQAHIKNFTKKNYSGDLNTLPVQEKTQCFTESKTIHNKAERTKTKDKSTKKNADPKSDKKSNTSPMKRLKSKTKSYRKIKLVINVICNKPNPPQCVETSRNESNNGSTTCNVSNVDLDFLNDFNIDEIIESLDTCENKSSNKRVQSDQELKKYESSKTFEKNNNNVKSNIQTCKNAQSDATDLIKILKGEEDDDLIRMSIENAKALPFNNNSLTPGNENSHTLENVSERIENGESKISQDNLLLPVQIKEETIVIPDILDTVPSTAENDMQHSMITTNINPIPSEHSSNVIKDKIFKENQQTVIASNVKESRENDGPSPDNFSNETNFIGTLCGDDNKNYTSKEGQKSNPLILNIDSCPVVTAVVNIDRDNMNSNLVKTEITNGIDNSTKENKKDNDAHIVYLQKPEQFNIKCAENHHEDKTNHNNAKLNEAIMDNKNSDDHKANNSTNQENCSKQDNTNVKEVENSGDQKKLPLINNIVIDEAKGPGKKVLNNNGYDKKASIAKDDFQMVTLQDNHKGDKEKSNGEEKYKKNEQRHLSQNDTMSNQSNLSDSDIHSNIKSKDLQTVQKLEERLFTCSGSKYSISTIIHTGKYSKIFKCKHPNGKLYALKMLTNTKYYLGKEKNEMLNSLIIDIPYDNLFIVYITNSFNVAEKWCFLMEYYPKNLSQALTEAGKPFSIEDIQDYARQLVMAVMVLKNNNMVHLDIKPKHILINGSSKMLKLCGFDTLTYINKMRSLPNVGTVNYRAPEVILGYESGFEIDVWSTGLVLYEMAANRKLFPGLYNNDILYKQMCTLGSIPYNMIRKSRFGGVHFVGTKFMRKFGFKGQNFNIISKIHKNNILYCSIYDAYYKNCGKHRSSTQQNSDIGKLSLFVKLLQKMLTMHPEFRLPMEYVYANPFIYDAYSNQEW